MIFASRPSWRGGGRRVRVESNRVASGNTGQGYHYHELVMGLLHSHLDWILFSFQSLYDENAFRIKPSTR